MRFGKFALALAIVARAAVDCGSGRDVAIVDRIDVVRNCEAVRRS